MILAQYAIRSKQEYIFRSNRLLDIVGGTEMIRDAFDWVYAAAEQEGIVCQTADVPFTLLPGLLAWRNCSAAAAT